MVLVRISSVVCPLVGSFVSGTVFLVLKIFESFVLVLVGENGFRTLRLVRSFWFFS
jgi:hypothetical protein